MRQMIVLFRYIDKIAVLSLHLLASCLHRLGGRIGPGLQSHTSLRWCRPRTLTGTRATFGFVSPLVAATVLAAASVTIPSTRTSQPCRPGNRTRGARTNTGAAGAFASRSNATRPIGTPVGTRVNARSNRRAVRPNHPQSGTINGNKLGSRKNPRAIKAATAARIAPTRRARSRASAGARGRGGMEYMLI